MEKQIAAFRFIPLVEWNAERPHATIKRAVQGRKAKGKRASLAVRMSKIRRRIREPSVKQALVKSMSLHDDPFKLLVALGLDQHPSIQSHIAHAKSTSKHLGNVKKGMQMCIGAVLYHTDPSSQMTKLAKAAKHNTKEVGKEQRRDAKHRSEQMPKRKNDLTKLLGQEWWPHVQQHLRPGQVFQVPSDDSFYLGLAQLSSFMDNVGENHVDAAIAANSSDDCDIVGELRPSGGVPVLEDSVFCKVIHPNPGKQKIFRRRGGAGSCLVKGDMLVNRVPVERVGDHLYVKSLGAPVHLSVAAHLMHRFAELRDARFTCWDVSKEIRYYLPEPELSTNLACEVLTQIVEQGAFNEDQAISVGSFAVGRVARFGVVSRARVRQVRQAFRVVHDPIRLVNFACPAAVDQPYIAL